MRMPVKITILKRRQNEDFLKEYADSIWPKCELFEEGQEFITADGIEMPEGMCGWAWADMHKCILTLSRGGNFEGVKPGVFITCCTDGFRPVSFKLERLEELEE